MRLYHEKKSNGVRVDDEKKGDGVRVHHKRKINKVRVHHQKEGWGESSPSERAIKCEFTMRKGAMG